MNKTSKPGNKAAIGTAKRFTIRFICCCALLFILLNVVPDGWFHALNTFIAGICGEFLRLLGTAMAVHGEVLRLGDFSVMVIGECSGIFLIPPLVSFMAAWPTGWMKRLSGCLIGTVSIFAVNICRIVLLFLIGIHFPVRSSKERRYGFFRFCWRWWRFTQRFISLF